MKLSRFGGEVDADDTGRRSILLMYLTLRDSEQYVRITQPGLEAKRLSFTPVILKRCGCRLPVPVPEQRRLHSKRAPRGDRL